MGNPFEKNPPAKNQSGALCIRVTHTLHTNNNGLRLRSSLQSTWLLPLWHSVLQTHSLSTHSLYNNTTITVNHKLSNVFPGIRVVLPSMNLAYIYTLCNFLGSLVCQPLRYIIGQTIMLHTMTVTVLSITTVLSGTTTPPYCLTPHLQHHDTTILCSSTI